MTTELSVWRDQAPGRARWVTELRRHGSESVGLGWVELVAQGGECSTEPELRDLQGFPLLPG